MTEYLLKVPPKFLRRNVSGEHAERLAIAEDDELTGVLDRMPAPAPKLQMEYIASDDPLDVADLAAYHAALARGLGREEVEQPMLRRHESRHGHVAI